jgi:hypothetical protein
MRTFRHLTLVIVFCHLLCCSLLAQKKPADHIPTPSEFLGFEVGADRQLADYRQITAYFKALRLKIWARPLWAKRCSSP